MLTVKDAARLGIDFCINTLGRDFVIKNRNNGTSAHGECEDGVFCFVGVDDKPLQAELNAPLFLDSKSKFPYRVSCNVSLADGHTDIVECVIPT